jgi:hypothetical protein
VVRDGPVRSNINWIGPAQPIGHTETMGSDARVPFTYAGIWPYAVVESLDELRGPIHGALELPHELAGAADAGSI